MIGPPEDVTHPNALGAPGAEPHRPGVQPVEDVVGRPD